MRKAWILLLCALGALQLPAQQSLQLKECIETALQNNLSLRQGANTATLAAEQLRQSRMDFYPSLGAGVNFARSQGKYLDNLSFGVSDNPVTVNSGLNVYSNYNLFSAFSRWHNLRSARLSLEASRAALDALKNDICAQVTFAYFQAVYDAENIHISENKIALLEQQTLRTEALVTAGKRTQGDLFNVKSQLATERVTLVNRNNQYNKDLLTLVQLMNADPEKTYALTAPDTSGALFTQQLPPLSQIYESALAQMPDLREKELRAQAGQESFQSAKAVYYPSVSISASANSNYTSNRLEILRYDTLAGQAFPVYGTNPVPYFEQISGYFYINTGLSVNVPIFQNGRSRLAVERSRINLANAQLDYENTRNNLIKEIQQAYLDAESAQARLAASGDQLRFLNETLSYMESKYQAGLVDFYTYSEALNNRTQAQTEALTARYDFLLKLKILDLYQGKDLTY